MPITNVLIIAAEIAISFGVAYFMTFKVIPFVLICKFVFPRCVKYVLTHPTDDANEFVEKLVKDTYDKFFESYTIKKKKK